MEQFVLKSRFLSHEEKTILFGKIPALKIEAIKALDLDNYISMFKAIYDGLQIEIPGLISSPTPSRVYVYCDLPAGSRYFSQQSYNSKTTRTEVYDIPIHYTTAALNEFLIPFLKDCVSFFSDVDVEQQQAFSYYYYLNAEYRRLTDVILGGMFLNIQDGKVISISSFSSLRSQVSMYTNQLPSMAFSTIDAENTWFYTQFLIPKEATTVEYKPTQEYLRNVSGYLTNQKNKLNNELYNLYEWSDNSNMDLVVGDKYFKLNGYYSFNNKHYLGMSINSSSPLYEQSSGAGSSAGTFTHSFEEYLYSNREVRPETSNLFNLTSYNRHGYYTNKGSFIFINADAITNTKAELSAGVPELIELDKEFFSSVIQIVKDEEAAIGGYLLADITKEKFRKREFSIKKEAFLSEKEVLNSRYISLKNSDSKLFILTKTSLAREAARKMSITRKITVALQPVVDMAVRLFAATDMELGIADPEYRFITCSQTALSGCHTVSSEISEALSIEIEKGKVLSEADSLARAIDTVKSIYVDVNYNGSPFMAWRPKTTGRYRDSFTYITLADKKIKILEYLYSGIIFADEGWHMSNIFSPSSGQLNITSLANNLYCSSHFSKYSEELAYLKHSSYGTRSATGKHVHYMYTNNFIGDNQKNLDEIEHQKASDCGSSLNNNLVAATTAFTFSEPAINTLATLKRCKTFADYGAWFTGIKPELEARVDTLFKTGDEYMYKTVLFMLGNFDNLLKGLVAEELQHLPKPKVRKKKEAVVVETETETIDLMEELETEPRSEEEVSNTLHLLQSLTAIGENNGNTTT